MAPFQKYWMYLKYIQAHTFQVPKENTIACYLSTPQEGKAVVPRDLV